MSSLLKSTSTSTTTPYTGEYADQLSELYSNYLKKNLDTSAEAYSGDLTAGLSDTQKQATSYLTGLLGDSALTDTASGKYLDVSTNPYLNQTYDLASDKVMNTLGKAYDNVNSNFNQRGLYNSSARMENLNTQTDNAATQLETLANDIYGTAYNNERTNQLNAVNSLAGLNNSLYGYGTTEQSTNQTALTNAYNEWLRQQGVDQNDISNMLTYFNMVKNPTTKTTTNSGLGVIIGTAAGAYVAGL